MSGSSNKQAKPDKVTSAKKNMPPLAQIDLSNRDPKNVNSDMVMIDFADVFAEPDSKQFTFDAVWELSYQMYTVTKYFSYWVLSLILGVPAALLWAIVFGLVSFCHIWCYMPSLRILAIHFRCVGQVCQMATDALISPLVRSLGLCLSQINVRHEQSEPTSVLVQTPRKMVSNEAVSDSIQGTRGTESSPNSTERHMESINLA